MADRLSASDDAGRGLPEQCMEVVDVNLSVRLVLAGVFLFAGLLKLMRASRMEVADILHAAGLKHSAFARAAGVPLAVFELVLAGLLLTENAAIPALVISALLLASFIGILSTAVIRGYSGSCSCFGPFSGAIDGSAILFDTFLVALSLVALFAADHAKGVENASVFDWLAGGGIALWLFAVKMLVHEVVSVRHRLSALRSRAG